MSCSVLLFNSLVVSYEHEPIIVVSPGPSIMLERGAITFRSMHHASFVSENRTTVSNSRKHGTLDNSDTIRAVNVQNVVYYHMFWLGNKVLMLNVNNCPPLLI